MIRTVKIKAYGKTPFDRELTVKGGDWHTLAHRAVMQFFEEPLNKKRKRNVTRMVITIE